MSKKRIYLSSPHLAGSEHKYMFNTNNWLDVKGENINEFESLLEGYLGGNVHVSALNSGTSALHLALVLLGVTAGDEVICQSMTFVASANPILYLGAIPIFVDSEPQTWNLSPEYLEVAIIDRIKRGKKPKAIIAVHLYGMPYRHDEIKKVSLKYDIPIVEDSAEALGSTYKNQKCGTLGDISILSFNGNKIITTSGGGALVTKSRNQKEKSILFSTQARENKPFYEHRHVGFNYRMNNLTAGIGIAQMKVLERYIELRREMHEAYTAFFKNITGVKVFTEPSADYFSNHWLTTILFNPQAIPLKTNESLRKTLEEANIETRMLWKPMHLQPVFEAYPYYGEQVSETIFDSGLCLPSSSNLTIEEKTRILEELQLFFQ